LIIRPVRDGLDEAVRTVAGSGENHQLPEAPRSNQAGQLIARLERAKGATVAEIADPIISGEASVEIVAETGRGP
jgi:hypothetical protein